MKHKLYKETAKHIKRLKPFEQKALFGIIESLELGVNFSREFTDYLIDLSKILQKPIQNILKTPEIQDILKSERLPRSRKIRLIKNLFFQMRYPYISTYNSHGNVGQGFMPCQSSKKPPVSVKPKAKQIIFAKQKGKWMKRCPGTPEHICCNYLVINNGMGCPFNCTYCYLQTYMNQSSFDRSVILYDNIDTLLKELKTFLKEETNGNFRIGTGEFTDSLALDNKVGLSEKLIKLFAKQDKHLLELKTKSTNIDHLLGLDHKGKTIFSWTLNPEILIRGDEQGTASLKDRLKAAKRCAEAGYKISFHFDPLIHIANWEEEYQRVVDQIFDYLKEEDLTWISLGALRFLPKQKPIVENRFPDSTRKDEIF
ncbi:MAG: radical SAM protein [Candidatus Saganbacteria bacterium]|nr:radical SAM protein [Candidatus Saganbacteria bacterium]